MLKGTLLMLFSDSFGHNTHSSTMLQNEVLDYFEKLLLIKSEFGNKEFMV